MSRYTKLKSYKGIKKDNSNGRYLAVKYINKKEYSKKFDSLRDAINWRASFHPSLAPEVLENSLKDSNHIFSNKPQVKLNGEDLGYYFNDVWKMYKELYLPSLEKSSQEHRLAKESFLGPLMSHKMVEMTANLIDVHVAKQKNVASKINGRRHSFDDDLKVLKAILNWYRQNYDPLFMNPVLPRHKTAGIIKPNKRKNKKMKPEEVIAFFNQLELFWRDFAETQFYMAARVSEVAGMQVSSVDFFEKIITVSHVAVWDRVSKQFSYLKEFPKNGEERYVFMNERLADIMNRRIPNSKNGYVFHQSGDPLRYKQIQYQYNSALKRAGLFPEYSSTHIMRHSMGTITRRVTGSLDATQAVTGHKDIRMAQHYASLPSEANKHAVTEVQKFMFDLEE
ncbi:MAG: tyrosine-type recombinase/integrase, partial [Bdellovibrionales bacterium]|nr:tyrosine-type recombinase/integrase [Bdellovibrionales bacterium]